MHPSWSAAYLQWTGRIFATTFHHIPEPGILPAYNRNHYTSSHFNWLEILLSYLLYAHNLCCEFHNYILSYTQSTTPTTYMLAIEISSQTISLIFDKIVAYNEGILTLLEVQSSTCSGIFQLYGLYKTWFCSCSKSTLHLEERNEQS